MALPEIDAMEESERDGCAPGLEPLPVRSVVRSVADALQERRRRSRPAREVSRRHRQRHGSPLFSTGVPTSPHDLHPRVRRPPQRGGSAGALHICRGHFKTFTSTLLFGSRTGRLQGRPPRGARQGPGRGVQSGPRRTGRPRVRESTSTSSSTALPSTVAWTPTPAAGLRTPGSRTPLRPPCPTPGSSPVALLPDEPQYDLADEVTAEVKSTTPANEECQPWLALGQVQRYVQQLEADDRTIRAVIAGKGPRPQSSCATRAWC